MAKILISGGSGFVGKSLAFYLTEAGHEVSILTRNPLKEKFFHAAYEWDITKGYIDPKAVELTEHIIHLAGENIASSRWTSKRKEEIKNSRVSGSELLIKYIKTLNPNLKSFIGASATGFYGTNPNPKTLFSEGDKAGEDFLATVCKLWENSYDAIKSTNIPLFIIRIGMVLNANGGALKKMIPLFKYGLGSQLGNGNQYMNWIHQQDLNRVFESIIEGKITAGIYNAVSNPVTNKEFTKELAKALKKNVIMPPVPSFALNLLYGEMAQILLTGNKISNQKLLNSKFEFNYPSITQALKNLLHDC